MTDLPTSPDLQAEAERVFADVQRAVLVEDAKQVIAKELQAAEQRGLDVAEARMADILKDPVAFRLNWLRGGIDASIVLREVKASSWKEGYLAGFAASGEGWNGEYPFADQNRSPEGSIEWLAARDRFLKVAFDA